MNDKTLKTIFEIPAVVLAAVITITWRGYVFTVLWGWFMVSTFKLPPLHLANAVGISLMIGHLTGKANPPKDFWPGIARHMSAAMLTLAIGWILHKFM